MPDLATELEQLHASIAVRTVRERVENGGEDEDGNWKPASNDDLRIALQLLKQDAVTANLSELDQTALKERDGRQAQLLCVEGQGWVVRMPSCYWTPSRRCLTPP